MDKQKATLIDAHVRLGSAQGDSILEQKKTEDKPSSTSLPEVSIKDVDDTVQDLQKWADLNDSKVNPWGILYFVSINLIPLSHQPQRGIFATQNPVLLANILAQPLYSAPFFSYEKLKMFCEQKSWIQNKKKDNKIKGADLK